MTATMTTPTVAEASAPSLDPAEVQVSYPATSAQLREALAGAGKVVTDTVDGRRWISNAYWITPLERFRDVIGPNLADGAYSTTEGTKREAWHELSDGAGILARFTDPAQYVTPIALDRVRGRLAMIGSGAPAKVAEEMLLVPFADGVSLNARFLRLVTNLEAITSELTYAQRWGAVHLRQVADKPLGPVGVFADVLEGSVNQYGTVSDLQPSRELLVGVIMPVRL